MRAIGFRETRGTLKIRVAVYAVTVVALIGTAGLCWFNPEGREIAFPLVIFFVLVTAYRLYLSLDLLRKTRHLAVK